MHELVNRTNPQVVVKLDKKIHSQKLLEIKVLAVRIAQFMSGKLKLPKIKTAWAWQGSSCS